MPKSLLTLVIFSATLAACGDEDSQTPNDGPNDSDTCLDEAYTETLPNQDASISALVANYSEADAYAFINDVLEARYPTGAYLVASALEEDEEDCIAYFEYDLDTAESALDELSTVVHECGHFLDGVRGGSSNDVFVFTPTKVFECQDGDTTDRSGNTFARSRIFDDAFSEERPPCSVDDSGTCDFYADIYLNGDADDNTFQSGDQGFNMLLEEAVQYVNSLAVGYAYIDYQTAAFVSARDGLLTLLWYVQRYLHMARLDFPDAYAFLTEDPCYRDAILTLWGRAWIYLDATADIDELGIDDETLLELVNDSVLLDEIERVRAASGCRG